jgi:hypothetical protein
MASTTAKREALAVVRRSRPEIASESAGNGLPAPGLSPEEVVVLAEMRAAVQAAADGLSERRKLLVDVLFYQSPRTYEEVSRRTGLPVGSIGPTCRSAGHGSRGVSGVDDRHRGSERRAWGTIATRSAGPLARRSTSAAGPGSVNAMTGPSRGPVHQQHLG